MILYFDRETEMQSLPPHAPRFQPMSRAIPPRMLAMLLLLLLLLLVVLMMTLRRLEALGVRPVGLRVARLLVSWVLLLPLPLFLLLLGVELVVGLELVALVLLVWLLLWLFPLLVAVLAVELVAHHCLKQVQPLLMDPPPHQETVLNFAM